METRNISVYCDITKADQSELRLATPAETPNRLVGYAAVFDSLSADLGGFRERIKPGAFDQSISAGVDVRALLDHDFTKILGRISAGTLRISEDSRGLRIEIDTPDTSYAKDAITSVKRGDISGMSFGFRVPPDGQRIIKENGNTIRELTKIDLLEVTVTSIPAYGDTSITLRIDPSIMAKINHESQQTADQTKLKMAKRRLQAA